MRPLQTFLLLALLVTLPACATTGDKAGKLDLSIVDAHLRSDAVCAGNVGQVLGRAGVQTALTAVGLPPSTANAASAFLAKLTGALDQHAKPDETLSLAEACATLAQNVRDDVTGGKLLIDRIKARIEARRAERAGK